MSRKPTNEVEDWVYSDGAAPPAWVIRDYILAVERERDEARAALEKLARLGNGERYGNSDGNLIAQAALATIKEPKP